MKEVCMILGEHQFSKSYKFGPGFKGLVKIIYICKLCGHVETQMMYKTEVKGAL